MTLLGGRSNATTFDATKAVMRMAASLDPDRAHRLQRFAGILSAALLIPGIVAFVELWSPGGPLEPVIIEIADILNAISTLVWFALLGTFWLQYRGTTARVRVGVAVLSLVAATLFNPGAKVLGSVMLGLLPLGTWLEAIAAASVVYALMKSNLPRVTVATGVGAAACTLAQTAGYILTKLQMIDISSVPDFLLLQLAFGLCFLASLSVAYLRDTASVRRTSVST